MDCLFLPLPPPPPQALEQLVPWGTITSTTGSPLEWDQGIFFSKGKRPNVPGMYFKNISLVCGALYLAGLPFAY